MESLRKWIDLTDEIEAPPALPTGVPVLRGAEPVQPAPLSRLPIAPTQVTTTTERRLKLIIESAPVSLMVVDASGQVLAANRATLSLFGIPRLEDVVGAHVGTLAAMESRERLAAFVTRVCGGEAGSLEYTLDRSDGTRSSLETHAVLLRRAEGGAPVLLGATWDVGLRDGAELEQFRAQVALLESDGEVLRAALEGAQTALADIERQHAHLAGEWITERQSLTARLAGIDQEKADLTSELTDVRERCDVALEQADRALQQAQGRAAEERGHLERDMRAAREQYEADLAESRAQHEKLAKSIQEQYEADLTESRAQHEKLAKGIQEQHEADLAESRAQHEKLAKAIQDVNASYAALVSEHGTERAGFEAALHAERSRGAELVSEREVFRTDLAVILHALQEAGVQTQQLLDRARNLRLVSNSNHPECAPQAETPGATVTDADQCSWQF